MSTRWSNKKVFLKLSLILLAAIFLLGGFLLAAGRLGKLGGEKADILWGSLETLDMGKLSEREVLRFAVIGDPHMGEKHPNEWILEMALEKAKQKGAEFVVIVGDITEDGKEKEYEMAKSVLDKVGLEYYLIPGDHDWKPGSLDNFEKYFQKTSQKIVRSLKSEVKERGLQEVELFLLNFSTYEAEKAWTDQLNWLRQEMLPEREDANKAIFVFQHFPPDYVSSQVGDNFERLFCQQKIDGLFFGHIHRYIKTWKSCQETDRVIRYFCPGAILNVQGEFKGFLIVHYFKDRRIEVERVLLDSFELYDFD